MLLIVYLQGLIIPFVLFFSILSVTLISSGLFICHTLEYTMYSLKLKWCCNVNAFKQYSD